MKNSSLLFSVRNNSCQTDYNKEFSKMVRINIMFNDGGG